MYAKLVSEARERIKVPVNSLDLGVTLCRTIMRDMDDRSLVLELFAGPGQRAHEYTTASNGAIAQQWCAVMSPTLDMVSVRAQLKFWGMGIWDQAELSPESEPSFRDYIFVRYPQDPAAITGPEFEAELRAAVEKALAAVGADRARVDAEYAAKRNA